MPTKCGERDDRKATARKKRRRGLSLKGHIQKVTLDLIKFFFSNCRRFSQDSRLFTNRSGSFIPLIDILRFKCQRNTAFLQPESLTVAMVMLLFSLAFAFIATEQLIEHVGLPISILKGYVRFGESWYTSLAESTLRLWGSCLYICTHLFINPSLKKRLICLRRPKLHA